MKKMERKKGRVIWFANTIGFICPEGCEEGESDVFFHYSELIMPDEGAFKTIEPGTEVTFGIGKNHRGKMAIEIIRAEEDSDETERMLVQEQYAE